MNTLKIPVANGQQAGLVAANNAISFRARGAVIANVASLAAFTVAGNDGLTYAEGEYVLLANQTTAAENGVYVVGAVSGGAAALTRANFMADASVLKAGAVVEVSEGTLYAGSSWKAMATGTITIGTNDPIFYPRVCKGILTLVAGTVTLGATEGLYLFSVTRSVVLLSQNTANTTTLTTEYCAVSATRVAGKSGTAAVVVRANIAAGTINVADISTLDWMVTNW